jgi:VWFA-related protein
MRASGFLAICALGLLAITGIATTGAQPAPQSDRAAAPSAGQQPQSHSSGYVLKVRTRLVSLDVVATDSHGNAVRDLKPAELQIFGGHNAPQKIAQFEFIEKLSEAELPKQPSPTGQSTNNTYSNQVTFEHLRIPPTVLLMDALNTPAQNQIQARSHMVHLLKTLPPNTPVAVLLLGNTLRLVQGFTSDPALLRAALDKAIDPKILDQDPRDDPNSASSVALDANDDAETPLIQQLEDFEKEQYSNTMDERERETLNTLTSIARYLSGIPGRKNLIWLSNSFPFTIAPDTATGNNPFTGVRNYADDVQAAANALTDAQVAVYPLDLRGLEAMQSLSASQRITLRRNSADQGIGARLNREQDARLQAQGTMEELAKDTGGKTCTNINDLSGCVETALKNSSSYYELAFYPQDVKWDGKFQKIEVKTSRPGVKLTYRRGYFALDADTLARVQKPEDRLRQACSDPLPPTAVRLAAQAVARPAGQPSEKYELTYLLLIAPGDMSLPQTGDAREIRIQAATCDFNAKGDSFRFFQQNLTQRVSDEMLKNWQAGGIPDLVGVAANADTRRIRIAVLDEPTGLTGAVDIPVRPADLAKVAEPSPAPATAIPTLEIADKQPTATALQPMGALVFHGSAGQAGALDWNGDTLIYQGDLGIGLTAPAFFSYAFGTSFQCQSGSLVANGAAGSQPKLQFTFRNHNGKVATVDLNGVQPQYSGDLPVDSSARTFFDEVWKLCHCVGK